MKTSHVAVSHMLCCHSYFFNADRGLILEKNGSAFSTSWFSVRPSDNCGLIMYLDRAPFVLFIFVS